MRLDGNRADVLLASIRRSGDLYEWSPSFGERSWLPVAGSTAEVEAGLGAIEDAAAGGAEGEAVAGEAPLTFSYRRGSSELRVSRSASHLPASLEALRAVAVGGRALRPRFAARLIEMIRARRAVATP